LCENFLQGLWRRGALTGTRPVEAFFMRCGPGTMTQADIGAGHLVVLVGIAPVRAGEFIILRLQPGR
jgi:phage tail sheath protein FI